MNLYGFVGNDGVDRSDIYGLNSDKLGVNAKVRKSLDGPIFRVAHEAGTKGLLAGEKEFLDAGSKARETLGTIPREYGGRVCKHCEFVDGKDVFSFYATQNPGLTNLEARSYDPTSAGVWVPTKDSECTFGDVEVAFWHSHPSERRVFPMGKVKIDYWSGGQSFSPKDLNSVDGIRELRDRKWIRTSGVAVNPKGLPLFVTFRRSSNINGDGIDIVTQLYMGTPNRTKYDNNVITYER